VPHRQRHLSFTREIHIVRCLVSAFRTVARTSGRWASSFKSTVCPPRLSVQGMHVGRGRANLAEVIASGVGFVSGNRSYCPSARRKSAPCHPRPGWLHQACVWHWHHQRVTKIRCHTQLRDASAKAKRRVVGAVCFRLNRTRRSFSFTCRAVQSSFKSSPARHSATVEELMHRHPELPRRVPILRTHRQKAGWVAGLSHRQVGRKPRGNHAKGKGIFCNSEPEPAPRWIILGRRCPNAGDARPGKGQTGLQA